MTLTVNFDARSIILQLFEIAFCAVSQPLNRKITKMGSFKSVRLKSYLENCFVNVFC